jgi:HCOMODA/2-hydroxy-3-carboxy-muconic semialdehyde decarboxylase
MKNHILVVVTLVAIAAITVVLAGQTTRSTPAPAGNGTLLDDLVVANRILANENILDGLGHVSVRSPQRPDHFFLSRDLAPGLVTAADLVEYDLDGNPVNPKAPQGYRERFLHGAIFKARPDVNAIVHSHMPSVLPFTDVTTPLRPMYHMASFLLDGAPVFEVRTVQGQIGMLIDNNKVGRGVGTDAWQEDDCADSRARRCHRRHDDS